MMNLKLLWWMIPLITFAVSCSVNHNTSAGDQLTEKHIYVSPDGNDQNEGTKAHPLLTLQQAAEQATAGTTVLVREGVYHEALDMKHSGNKAKPIIFKNYKNEEVEISGKHVQDVDGEKALLHIMNKNYITVQGFTITDLSTASSDTTVMGIYVTGSSSYIELNQNHVQRIETKADDGNAHGIAVYGTGEMKDIQIRDNIIEDLKLGASESLVLNGNIDGFVIANNTVRHNNNIGIDLIGYEGTARRQDYVRNGTVTHNDVYGNSSYGNPAYGDDYSAAGIYVDGGNNIELKQNKVYENDIGIEATSEHSRKYANEIEITDNEVHHNAFTGISIGGYDEKRGGTVHSVISHNTIYHNDFKGLEGGQLLFQYNTKDNKITDNIITASDSRIFLANDFTANKGNLLTRNVYHKEKGKKGIWIWKGEAFESFSAYQKRTNNDLESAYIPQH